MGRKSYRLLRIIDVTQWQRRLFLGEGNEDTYTVKVDRGIVELMSKLRWMLDEGMTFQNAVFRTHGCSGAIWFGEDYINAEKWYTLFHYCRYERLFPFKDGKLYFEGCNVAEGAEGWRFLEAAARSLRSGGVAIGWTSLGYSAASSSVKHLWGDTRQVTFIPERGGADLYFFENGKRVDDGVNRPS